MRGSWLPVGLGVVMLVGSAVASVAPARAAWLAAEVYDREPDVAEEIAARRAAAAAIEAEIATLEATLATPEAPNPGACLVIGVQDRTLVHWAGGGVKRRLKVAVGMGERVLDGEVFRFETPRGSYKVLEKEEAPLWVPPDWHYVELGLKKRAEPTPVTRSRPLQLGDGSRIEVTGDTLSRCAEAGCTPYLQGEEIVVEGKLVVPPIGTLQRSYPGILGSHRLKLGDGYAIHGTDKPGSIGRAASHGCIRVRNEDVAVLFEEVNVGTPVLIY